MQQGNAFFTPSHTDCITNDEHPAQQQHGHKSLLLELLSLSFQDASVVCWLMLLPFGCIYFSFHDGTNSSRMRATQQSMPRSMLTNTQYNMAALRWGRCKQQAMSRKKWVARVESFGSFTSCLSRAGFVDAGRVFFCRYLSWWEKASS